MINSRLGLFTAACLRRHPFFRSYGVNMPSSLTTLLPLALGFSPHPPVSVSGTGARFPFLATPSSCFPTIFSPFRPRLPARGSRLRGVSVSSSDRLRILYRICIDYAFRPRLSSRLTLGGRTYPRKPWIFGHYDSHAILATHSGILTSLQSTRASAHASPRTQRSPTIPKGILSFGYTLSPVKSSAQHHSTSELLRTLSMSGCF